MKEAEALLDLFCVDKYGDGFKEPVKPTDRGDDGWAFAYYEINMQAYLQVRKRSVKLALLHVEEREKPVSYGEAPTYQTRYISHAEKKHWQQIKTYLEKL